MPTTDELQAQLDALSNTVTTKADTDPVTTLQNQITAKANQSDLILKANQTDLDALTTTVSGKASQASVDAIATTVAGKADHPELDALRNLTDSTFTAELDGRYGKQPIIDALQPQLDTFQSKASLEADVAGKVGSSGTLDAALNAKYAARPGVRPYLADKIFGGNIVPAPGTWGWRDLFSAWDWANWIQPQVDRAAILGMNAVRLIGCPSVVLAPPASGSTAPAITQAQYVAQWEQLAAYCETKGMALYPCLTTWQGDYVDRGLADTSDPTILAAIVASASALAKHPNVIGYDVFSEGGAGTSPTLAMMASVRSVAPNIPLTCSHPTGTAGTGGFTNGWNDTTTSPYAVLTSVGGSDFADYHMYADSVDPNYADVVIQRSAKPLLIGETGADQSLTSAARVARYTAMATLHNRANVIGTFLWGLADQKTSATPSLQFGVWDNTGWASGTSPLSLTSGQRTDMTNLLRLFNRNAPSAPYAQPNLLDPGASRPIQSVALWSTGAGTTVVNSARGAKFSRTAGSGTGAISGGTATGLGYVPVTGTGFYRVGSTFLGDVARTATISLNWYDASKTFLSSSTGVSGTDSTNNPLTIQEVAQAPSSAAFAVPHINVAAVPEGEFHYVLDTFVKPY